jgi:hypothetical protein
MCGILVIKTKEKGRNELDLGKNRTYMKRIEKQSTTTSYE